MHQSAIYSFSVGSSNELAKGNMLSGLIVLIDHDNELNQRIQEFLREHGFNVFVETSGKRGKRLIESLDPMLVILDIVLPDVDGLSFCREVRMRYKGPILIMTTLTDAIDEVASLEIGADGYLTKPIQPRVVLAHIRALLRRYLVDLPNQSVVSERKELSDQFLPSADQETLVVGRIKISLNTRTVWLKGKRFDMTSGEFDTLWHLASYAGQILSREKLYYHLRGIEYDGMDRAVDQHISNIRKKFGDDPKAPSIIKSIRGIGYLLAG